MPNKNKTNPRENLEFVFSFQASREGSLGSFGLFFVRDYSGLSVKLRIIKGERECQEKCVSFLG